MHSINSIQRLPISIEEAWDFFSDPKNLNIITPDSMKFVTLSGDDRKMFSGQIIQYKITPFSGITMKWVTEITHVTQNAFFVDEQRFGPYKFWHHKHFFRSIDGGVEMEDIVHYKLAFGFVGELLHRVLIKPKLNEVFEFRRMKLTELFGEFK